MSDVGFVGARLMGTGMIRSLMAAGMSVSVVAHRRRENIDALVAEGAVEARSLAEMVAQCPIFITCVSDASAVEAIADEVIQLLGKDQIWIDATTSDPELSKFIAEKVAARGRQVYVNYSL